MRMKGHHLKEKVGLPLFLDLIRHIKEEDVLITNHTFTRLEEQERKIYKEESIRNIVVSQKPIIVGRQYNGNYAVYYYFKGAVIKIIMDIKFSSLHVVTFYVVEKNRIPRL